MSDFETRRANHANRVKQVHAMVKAFKKQRIALRQLAEDCDYDADRHVQRTATAVAESMGDLINRLETLR